MVIFFYKILFFLIAFFMVTCSWATLVDNVSENKSSNKMILYVNRLGLDWSKTDVKNAYEYRYSSIQALKAISQDYIKGVLDAGLEYSAGKFRWDNTLLMEYGQTSLEPYNASKIVDENADNFIISTGVSYSCWDFMNLKFGPSFRAAYDTEFVTRYSLPRQNIFRLSPGVALLDNDILKSLYLTVVYEYDFTYDYVNDKLGAEIGFRLEYIPRKGVKISAGGYFREFFSYSSYDPYDLERDLNVVLRMDTNMWGKLTMGPYIQYRLAKARGTDVYGSNFMIGLSFNYIDKYILF